MKFRHLFPAFCSVLMMFSCNPDQPNNPDTPDGPENPDEPKKENPAPGVYKFVIPDYSSKASVVEGGKATWEAGDEILVSGGYYPDAVTVKLQASDISGDGKTATVNLAKVPGSVYGPDDFYAGYPAGLVDPESTFTEDSFDFTDTDAPLMCGWLDGDTFNMVHVTAAVTFTVKGDFDGCVFSAKTWDLIKYATWSARANSENMTLKNGKSGPEYYLRKDIKNGSATLFFPGGFNLSEGFYIYMRKGNTYPKVFSYDQTAKLNPGDVIALGDISSKLQDYSGPAPEMPDMPVMGNYTKYTVKDVIEMSGICLKADKSGLWAVGDNGQLAEISFDGVVTKHWSKSCGMEDVTIHPVTGDLYIADEDNYRVVRVDAPEYKNSYTTVLTLQEAKGYGNSGIEGVTYYKDDILFVGTQVDASVWKYSITGEKLSEKVPLRTLTKSAILEVGGLCWDAVNNWLWLIDSETQKIYILDEELTHILASYPIKYAGNCESLCVDHAHNCVWVGDDNDSASRLFKIEFTGLNP